VPIVTTNKWQHFEACANDAFRQVSDLKVKELLDQRYDKLQSLGRFTDTKADVARLYLAWWMSADLTLRCRAEPIFHRSRSSCPSRG
jgi:hypothetical protein